MSLRSRVVTLAGFAMAVGGLASAPAVFTATPASALTHVPITCTSSSTPSTPYTHVSVWVTGNASSGSSVYISASSTAYSSSSTSPPTTISLTCT
jgi:hypothetical protein